MKCVLSHFTLLATILFTFLLPTEVTCCSYNTYDIITIMHQDSNYQQDPCYIKWKADEDAKLNEIFKQRERLEKSIADNERISSENRAREYQIRYNNYATPKVEQNKDRGKYAETVLMFLAIFAVVFVAMCCCAVCFSSTKSENNPTAIATTNNLQTVRNPGGLIPVSTMSVLSSNPRENQTTSDYSMNPNNNANLIAPATEVQGSNPQQRTQASSRQQSENNVPLLSTAVINRKNSLPSYDDAIRMLSAPPKE